MKQMICVQNLVKRYKNADRNAVDGISFTVKAGEFFAFLGPNGAGKTTTISILTTTLAKTSGEVTIAGYDLDKESGKVRQNVGIIFQKPSLDLNLTAEENIRLHAVLYGLFPFRPTFSMMPENYRHRVLELGEMMGMKQEIFTPMKTFSGGMKRKMEIIRSLMHDPKILFLDEPTEGLDPVSRRNLWDYLMEIRMKQDITIFLTTHYLAEAEQSDRVCILNHGKIVSIGTPSEIKQKIVEEYLLVDAVNRSALKRELTDLGMSFTDGKIIKVNLDHKLPQEIIKSINTPLTVLQIHIPSLEDAYLEIVEDKNDSSRD